TLSNSSFLRNRGTNYVFRDFGKGFGGALAIAASMQGDILRNIFSDNALDYVGYTQPAMGGAIGVMNTYQGTIAENTFTTNSAIQGSAPWSEGGALGFSGFVQQQVQIQDNVFSKNSAS